MEKTIKIMIILFTILSITTLIIPNITYAKGSDITSSGFDIDPENYRPSTENMPDKVEDTASKVLGIITIIGATLSVVILAIIGFGFMTGSAAEKAIDQEKLITFLIGAILLTAGSGIIKLIINSVSNW